MRQWDTIAERFIHSRALGWRLLRLLAIAGPPLAFAAVALASMQ
jgi:hypothetical protein